MDIFPAPKDLIQDIITSIASTLLVFFFFWSYINVTLNRRYRRMTKFFGISNKSPAFEIFCSRIMTNSTQNGMNQLAEGVDGVVFSVAESLAAGEVRDQLKGGRYPTGRNLIEILKSGEPPFFIIDPKIMPSPSAEELKKISPESGHKSSIEDYFLKNTLLIGSDAYNTLTTILCELGGLDAIFTHQDEYRAEGYSIRCFKKTNSGKSEPIILLPTRIPKKFAENFLNIHGNPVIKATRESAESQSFKSENKLAVGNDSFEGAIIQRRVLENGNVVVICAGLSGNASYMAMLFLLESVKIKREFTEKRDFCVYIAWKDLPIKETGTLTYRRPERSYYVNKYNSMNMEQLKEANSLL